MTDHPIRVYLDSCDYSVLSNPRNQTARSIELCEKLRSWAKSGEVEFLFSGTHLSEMAPLDASYTPAATARADLLVDLCGRKSFVSCDRLLSFELMSIYQPLDCNDLVLSMNAEWFPDVSDSVSQIVNVANQTVNDISKQYGLNRQQRRQLKQNFFKHGHPKRNTDLNISGVYEEILASYPMREQDARVISQYILGTVTAQQVHEALLESLRDPRWMTLWFATNFDKLTPLSTMVRAPSQALKTIIQGIYEQTAILRNVDKTIGTNQVSDYLTSRSFKEEQDKLFVNVATRLQSALLNIDAPELTVEVLYNKCPGYSAFLRSFLSSMCSSLGKNPRSPKDSDLVDSIHAMYAPYVDVFRADNYMTPHIQKQVARHGTIVAPNLDALLFAIEQKLEYKFEY